MWHYPNVYVTSYLSSKKEIILDSYLWWDHFFPQKTRIESMIWIFSVFTKLRIIQKNILLSNHEYILAPLFWFISNEKSQLLSILCSSWTLGGCAGASSFYFHSNFFLRICDLKKLKNSSFQITYSVTNHSSVERFGFVWLFCWEDSNSNFFSWSIRIHNLVPLLWILVLFDSKFSEIFSQNCFFLPPQSYFTFAFLFFFFFKEYLTN